MARTSVETALFFFLCPLAALCLRLNCMDVRTSLKKPSMQQEQQPQYQSVNQIIISNSFFFLLQKEGVTGVPNDKGCPTAPQSRQTMERRLQFCHGVKVSVFSIDLFVSRGFKGKVAVFTSWMLCMFFCFYVKGRGEVCHSVMYWGATSLLWKASARWSKLFICEFYRLKFIYDKLYC